MRYSRPLVETESDVGVGAVGLGDAEPISPELVLVCPELRAQALLRLPERAPDAWIPRRLSLAPPMSALPPHAAAEETSPPAGPGHGHEDVVMEAEALRGRSLVVPAAAYFFQSASSAALVGAKLVGVMILLVGLADVLHH